MSCRTGQIPVLQEKKVDGMAGLKIGTDERLIWTLKAIRFHQMVQPGTG